MPNRSRTRFATDIRGIKSALATLDRLLPSLLVAVRRTSSTEGTAETAPKRKLKLSAKRRAQLKLQGQYMGYLRNLKPRQKAQVKAVREKKGMRAAILVAKRMATQRVA